MNKEITKPRRQQLFELLENDQMAVVFANMEIDGIEKFSQDNNFLYLTGLQVPDAVYCLSKLKDKQQEMLFIQRGIPEREVWDGKKMTPSDATEISGIETVKFLDEFYGWMNMFGPSLQKIWSNLGSPSINRPPCYPAFMLQPVKETFSNLRLENLNNLIRSLRTVKTEWEIKQMQTAIDLTGQGFLDVLAQARGGMMEYELEAILHYRMQRGGVQKWGFAPIVAAGVNAATLHYKQNNCLINEQDVVLMDIGASHLNYSADITRCFPVAGRFSPRQRDVYAAVLAVQKAVIELIKPGIGLLQLNEKTNELIQDALLDLGLIREREEFRRYYMHSISHHLGLDTHDLGLRDSVLEAGNVITVEPGIYIPEENLGIRIEDDILVTVSGHENLSHAIPKETADIEELRQAGLA